jgi:hypothetical protein
MVKRRPTLSKTSRRFFITYNCLAFAVCKPVIYYHVGQGLELIVYARVCCDDGQISVDLCVMCCYLMYMSRLLPRLLGTIPEDKGHERN